ncbi:MAG: protein kinase domain-containing protein [bacterium]
MEYVEGETLAQKIEQGPLEISRALDVVIQIAEALRAAHARGLIHGDIKSTNIMLTPEGVVKVLDFGLAKFIARSANLYTGNDQVATKRPSITEVSSCETNGTPSYMSPEQARGEPLDARTDIFSLGVVLYEMLAARRPFAGESPAAVLHAILSDEPPSLSTFRDDIPLELESMVRKALAKNRDERYQAAAEMLSALRKLKEQLVTPAQLEESTATLERQPARMIWDRRYRKWFLGAGILATLAAGVDILLLQPQGGEWMRSVGFILLALIGFVGFFSLRRQAVSAISLLPKGAAFRGLLPFQEADRDLFYGRENETVALFDMITRQGLRFGVLYGDSGCGKTSLLRAGLLPKLWQNGFVPIYCRSYKDPLAAILAASRQRSQIEPRDGESPLDFLSRAAEEMNAPFVVVCDQFEEFFVNFKTKRAREPFIAFVVACHQAANLPVKFLFALRSDFLYRISAAFDQRITEPLLSTKRYHLHNFDAAQAEEIIAKSVGRANLPFEPGLSRQVARDLAVNDIVLPSELQIVGEQLQSKRIFTLQEYRRTGGKEPLVHGYLEDVIQSSGEQETAKLLLRSLISEENTRLTLPLAEITKRAQRSEHTVERILNLFVLSRLIREIQEEEPWRYELMHEYLIEKINQITGKVMDATQRANRLFRQYLSSYVVDKRTRIPLSKLWFIRRYAEIAQGERKRELLRKSWRSGLLQAGALGMLLLIGATLTAAALSVREEWNGMRLSDGHAGAVLQAVFSPDGKRLVSVSEDSTVIVWDFNRRERLATFDDHQGPVNSVAFSPDGKWFATVSSDQTVIVWDAVRLEKEAVLSEHHAVVTSVAFSPDGRFLISASFGNDNRTLLWKVGSWERMRELPFGVEYGNFLFSKDGRQLMTRRAQAWNLETGQQVTFDLGPQASWSWAADSPDGSRRVIGTSGGVSFWDLTQKKLLSSQRGHHDGCRTVAYSPDGRLAASGAEDIVLWDAMTQTQLARLKHAAIVWHLVFSSDGRWLISTHGDGAILLWDVAERECIANFNQHRAPVHVVAFSPDGKQLASASEDYSLIVWDLEQQRKEAVLVAHQDWVSAAAFLPDGKSLASGYRDGKIIIWDLEQRQPRLSFMGMERGATPTYILVVAPNGEWLATTHGVFRTSDGARLVDFLGDKDHQKHNGYFYGLAVSPDGRRLVCTSAGGRIFVFDTGNWQLLENFIEDKTCIRRASFSPDGKLLATCDNLGQVRLWKINPLQQLAVIGHHSARIKSVMFSPDGSRIVSAGDDQTIKLWDVRRRRLITEIGSHTAPVSWATFSPDGKQIASGEGDALVRLYIRHRLLWGYRLE